MADDNNATAGLRVIDVKQNDRLARIDRSRPGHARVVATAAIPANTFLAVYPGWVYPKRAFQKLVDAGRRGEKYNVTGFKLRPSDGAPSFHWQIDPTNGVNRVAPRFAASFGPFMNEPSPGQVANVRWVLNFKDETMEYWTATSVQPGEELLICYGGEYQRDYNVACGRAVQDYYIMEGMRAPRPYFDALNSKLVRARSTPAANDAKARIVEDAVLMHHHLGMQAKVAATGLSDYEVWIRHNTPVIKVVDDAGAVLLRIYLPGDPTISVRALHTLVRVEYCKRFACPPDTEFVPAYIDNAEVPLPLSWYEHLTISNLNLKHGSELDAVRYTYTGNGAGWQRLPRNAAPAAVPARRRRRRL